MQHRLLILGSLKEFCELVILAKKRGYYTIVCDGYSDGPAKKIADKSYTIDVRSVDSIAEMCIEEKVDGIITSFSDLLFEQATKIADKAGIRWYAKPDMIPYYREKNIAKALLREIGVCVPRNCVIQKDFSDDVLNEFHFPVVIKPVNGYGSKGIFVVHSIEEIRERFDDVTVRSTMNSVQVEEYSLGREYNMMTWMIDGQVIPISIADREKNPQTGDRIPLLNRVVYPAKAIHTVIDEALTVLKKFADATGQRDGALSMQFFYNENGVEVCEIAGRMFGYEHELVTYGSGFAVEEMLLNYVYDTDALKQMMLNHSPFMHKHCAGLYFIGRQGKIIEDQSIVYELSKDPHVLEFEAFYKDGEVVDNYGKNSYLVRYYLGAPTRAELDSVTEMFFEKMYVRTDDGENLAYHFILEQ